MKKLLLAIVLIVGCEDEDAPTAISHDDGHFTCIWGTNSLVDEEGNPVVYNVCFTSTVDADGNIYSTIQIEDQVWMGENLQVTHYQNGDVIPTGLNSSGWANTTNGAYSLSGNGGYLYNWASVNDQRGVCPVDWRIPTDEDFINLEIALGMNNDDAYGDGYRGVEEGIGSKIAGGDLWSNSELKNHSHFGESGFDAVPNGYLTNQGLYYNPDHGFIWTSSEKSTSEAWYRLLSPGSSGIYRHGRNKITGQNIRCVGDAITGLSAIGVWKCTRPFYCKVLTTLFENMKRFQTKSSRIPGIQTLYY